MPRIINYLKFNGRKVTEVEYRYDSDFNVHYHYAYLLIEDGRPIDYTTREGMEKVEINKEDFHLLCRLFMEKEVNAL